MIRASCPAYWAWQSWGCLLRGNWQSIIRARQGDDVSLEKEAATIIVSRRKKNITAVFIAQNNDCAIIFSVHRRNFKNRETKKEKWKRKCDDLYLVGWSSQVVKIIVDPKVVKVKSRRHFNIFSSLVYEGNKTERVISNHTQTHTRPSIKLKRLTAIGVVVIISCDFCLIFFTRETQWSNAILSLFKKATRLKDRFFLTSEGTFKSNVLAHWEARTILSFFIMLTTKILLLAESFLLYFLTRRHKNYYLICNLRSESTGLEKSFHSERFGSLLSRLVPSRKRGLTSLLLL